MSDIFISYASADRPRAAQVAQALQARGWSVWWDRAIPPGRQFDEVIEEALDAARCVVVLWSKASTASSWVKTEAAEAMRRTVLIPALIDPDVRIPLEFRRLQAADLAHWNGADPTPEFEQFCAAIATELAGNDPAPIPQPPAPMPPRPAPAPPHPRPAPPQPGPAPHPAPGPTPRPDPGPAPVPPPPAPRKSRTALWVGIGVAVLALAGVGALFDQTSHGGGNAPAPDIPLARGLDMNLQWRDYVLAYSGHVAWDGRSDHAQIVTQVVDGYTGTPLGTHDLQAAVFQPGSGQLVLSTVVPVPGDSRTPGRHTHPVNLFFQGQPGGGWQFVRNCMDAAQSQCW